MRRRGHPYYQIGQECAAPLGVLIGLAVLAAVVHEIGRALGAWR